MLSHVRLCDFFPTGKPNAIMGITSNVIIRGKMDHFPNLNTLTSNELLWHPSQPIEIFQCVTNLELKSNLKHHDLC